MLYKHHPFSQMRTGSQYNQMKGYAKQVQNRIGSIEISTGRPLVELQTIGEQCADAVAAANHSRDHAPVRASQESSCRARPVNRAIDRIHIAVFRAVRTALWQEDQVADARRRVIGRAARVEQLLKWNTRSTASNNCLRSEVDDVGDVPSLVGCADTSTASASVGEIRVDQVKKETQVVNYNRREAARN